MPEREPAINRDLRVLAPAFGLALADGLNACWRKGLDPVVFEALRTRERQDWLYAAGRTRPGAIVTKARESWHLYGLAADIVSRKMRWSAPGDWWLAVAEELEARNLVWGGRWTGFPDLPHFQWGRPMAKSPRTASRLAREGGLVAVWRAVDAL